MYEPPELIDDRLQCFDCHTMFKEEYISDDYFDINVCDTCAQKREENNE